MQYLKKHWYLILVVLFTIGLGVMVYITSQQLATTKNVAPNVAQVQPKAAAAACTLAFAINATGTTPTNTPTPTPTRAPTNTPTSTPTPTPTTTQQIVYVNPTATPTPIQKAPASCNNACTVNTDCASGLVCVDGACRNASCTNDATCSCTVAATATPGPTPKTPVSGGPTVLGISVVSAGVLILLLGLAL